ncbi:MULTISPECIES: DUF4274 domain-containing protein [Sphingobacterium]|uniref:DUF4274 domain-containing protein n=1 Tax=Sphingobacterium TaxID=28453 RepID=UPI00257C9B9F|nr:MULTISPECIES: DUF4274 domain-containing protein [Sphingobacterium]
MKYKISEKRAVFLSKTFFEYSFKGNELDREVLAAITEPIELDFIAKNHNYDDGNDLLLAIVSHPYCDISTVKMIFHRADVEGYLKDGERSGDFRLIKAIITHLDNGFYTHEKFYYDPASDPAALSFDAEELKKYIREDAVLFGNPRGKKLETSFADNFHRRNLKFYDGTVKTAIVPTGLNVKTGGCNITFKVPEGNFKIVEESTVKNFIDCYTFPAGLKESFGVSEKQLKKVIIRPDLVIENDELLLVLFLFNSKALQLENALTNVSTMMRNEFFYLQAFVDIVGVEENFGKIARIKHNDTWFAVSRGMQVKISNQENLKFLKLILLEKGGIVFSLSVVSDQIENLDNEVIKNLINNCSLD